MLYVYVLNVTVEACARQILYLCFRILVDFDTLVLDLFCYVTCLCFCAACTLFPCCVYYSVCTNVYCYVCLHICDLNT